MKMSEDLDWLRQMADAEDGCCVNIGSQPLGDAIISQAREYLDVPFKHAGRNRWGLDCAGLLMVVAHDLGLTDWDCVNYSRQVDCNFLRECIERFCDRAEGEWQAGDVLLLSIQRHPQHLALYAGEGMMIHAHESAGRVVLHRFDRFWERRLEAVYRWRVEQ